MDVEPTTLADVIRLIAEVLRQHYGVDPEPLLAKAGIDAHRAAVSGSRVSREAILQLWELAAAATHDPSVGLVIGSKVRATTFYALGMAFLTCETLTESLEILCRYYRVIATVPLELKLQAGAKVSRLEIAYIDPAYPLAPIPFDSFIASIVGLCRLAMSPEFNPVEVRLAFADNHRGGDYEALFKAPVVFGTNKNALVFATDELNVPLPGRSADVLHASDRILDNYLAALNPDEISTEVRKLLLTLLPTGHANQELVSKRLHMSRSTLHRRLRDENTNYKELLDDTRRSLAIEYVREGSYALGYIAFLLGFSDQSNFSRAFRRWTGQSPKAFREPSARAADDAGSH
jgi:AraC-like DNA-binding protein